jgi:cell division GTPase FtsZ
LINISTKGARSVLFSISAADDLKMNEISIIADTITKEAHENAMIKFGTTRNLKLKKGSIKITVVASNFNDSNFSYSDTETFGIKIDNSEKNDAIVKEKVMEFEGEEIIKKTKKEKGLLASFIDLFKL